MFKMHKKYCVIRKFFLFVQLRRYSPQLKVEIEDGREAP